MMNTDYLLQRCQRFWTLSCAIMFCCGTTYGSDMPRHAAEEYWLVRYYGHPTYDYYAPWRVLTNQIRWNPTLEAALPADIAVLARAAYATIHQNRGTTNLLRISSINISRVGYSREERAVLTNQWFVVFTFSIDEPEPYYRHIVMLPDGTVAEQRRVVARTLVNHNTEGRTPERARQSQPQLDAENRWTRISPVQWNPLVNEFPLDLRTEVMRADLFLRRSCGISGSTLLEGIDIYHYAPLNLIREQRLSLLDHLHHWYVRLTFSATQDGRERKEHYMVNLNLDGVIDRAFRNGMEIP